MSDMDTQINTCGDCGNSYDTFFGDCGCRLPVALCSPDCWQEFNVCNRNNICPHCVKYNDVVTGIWNGTTEPLYLAISQGDMDYYGQRASVNYRTPFGKSVIELIAGKKDVEKLHRLLEDGANPNALDQDGQCALFSASQMGDVESFKMLIYYGANPNVLSLDRDWEDYWEGTEEEKEELKDFIKNGCGDNIKG